MTDHLANFATALIAALTIYGFFDQFSFSHPTLTVSGPHGRMDVDLNRLADRPVEESKLHIATWYAQARMGFV